ncbi:Lipase-like PAD4 [Bienertia sinuspersici]
MQMKTLVEQNNSIVLTGHSIGGAIASLTALWLLSNLQTTSEAPKILCITYGSPLLGNKSLLKSLLRQRWSGNFCHVVLKHDIIPRLLFAPLIPISTQIHFLLQYIHASVTSESEQIPLHVADEIKDHLFRFVLAYTDAATKETEENKVTQTSAGLFWPFGNYLFCSEEGAVCVDNAVAVVKLLHLMLAMGNSGSCFEDHLKYGGCVEQMSYRFLMRKGFMQGDDDATISSYEAGNQFLDKLKTALKW